MAYLFNWLIQAWKGVYQSFVDWIIAPVCSFLYAALSFIIYILLGFVCFIINGLVVVGVIVTDQICYLFSYWLPSVLNYGGYLQAAFGYVNTALQGLSNLSFLKWALYWFFTDIIRTMFFSALALILPILIFKIAFRIVRG